jgi:predicted nucleic acid-binding protein
MIVVSDTSPINYLLAIGQVEILPKLFGTIVIPSVVMAELKAGNAPASHLRWLTKLPAGFEVRSAAHLDPALDSASLRSPSWGKPAAHRVSRRLRT